MLPTGRARGAASSGKEIKIDDLFDNLRLPALSGLRTEQDQSREQCYYRALEILLASPTRTLPESLDLKGHRQQAGLIEERYSRSTLAVGSRGLIPCMENHMTRVAAGR